MCTSVQSALINSALLQGVKAWEEGGEMFFLSSFSQLKKFLGVICVKIISRAKNIFIKEHFCNSQLNLFSGQND